MDELVGVGETFGSGRKYCTSDTHNTERREMKEGKRPYE
jgi:hypothetical protein